MDYPRTQKPMDDTLLPREACALVRVTLRTLRNWRSKGFGPQPVNLAPPGQRPRYRYRRSDLLAWLAGTLSTPTPEGAADGR